MALILVISWTCTHYGGHHRWWTFVLQVTLLITIMRVQKPLRAPLYFAVSSNIWMMVSLLSMAQLAASHQYLSLLTAHQRIRRSTHEKQQNNWCSNQNPSAPYVGTEGFIMAKPVCRGFLDNLEGERRRWYNAAAGRHLVSFEPETWDRRWLMMSPDSYIALPSMKDRHGTRRLPPTSMRHLTRAASSATYHA